MIDLLRLKDQSSAKRFPEGTLIIGEGDACPCAMYIVLKGSVGVYKNYLQPDQIMVSHLKPGEFFGEMSLFLGQPRSASVVALSDLIALEINKNNTYEMIEKNSDIEMHVVKVLCSRINELHELLDIEERIDPGGLNEMDSDTPFLAIKTLCLRISDLNQLLTRELKFRRCSY